jgi:hypothetical protein
MIDKSEAASSCNLQIVFPKQHLTEAQMKTKGGGGGKEAGVSHIFRISEIV